MTDRETYLARAAQARADADAATLDNVRERHLRSALAWRQMAERLTRAEALRATRDEEKASDAALV